jgi:hypothetical protein
MGELLSHRFVSRRGFVSGSTRAGLLGLAAWACGRGPAQAAEKSSNPFAYDLQHLRKIDPTLLHYETVGMIRVPRAEARRVAIGPEDHLFVAAGNYVSVLDGAGSRLSEIALAAPARCLAVARDGMLYVGLKDHIEVFDSKGPRRAAWESPGGRTWFTGLAIGENDLFAADAGRRVVWRFDRVGKLLGRIGEKNKERNIPSFIVPSPFFDVELHRDGLLRVTNPGRHRVEAYTFDGDLELTWGKPSFAIDGFSGCCNPINLALLPDGRIVTCEKGLPRVKVYSVTGVLESVVAGPESFAENAKTCDPSDCTTGGLDAAVDSQGRIYVLDLVTNEIRVMARKPTV